MVILRLLSGILSLNMLIITEFSVLKRSLFVKLFSFLLLFLTSKSFAVAVSFDALKGLVEAKNEKVLSHKQILLASKKREKKLSRSYFPKLSVIAGYESFVVGKQGRENQPEYGLEASVNLYNGGKDRLRDKVQLIVTDRRENEIKSIIATEVEYARELFWELAYLTEEQELNRKMKLINTRNLKSAEKRIKSGVATPSDRLEFSMKELDLNRDYRDTSAKISFVSYDLKILIGVPLEKKLEVNSKLSHASEWEQDLKHSHQEHEFSSKPAELHAEELMLKGKIQSREWWPELELYAGWNQFTQREEGAILASDRQESVVGLRITMDLSKSISARRETLAMQAEANAAQKLSHYKNKQNEAIIEKEFLKLSILHEQVHDADKHIDMAQKYFKSTQQEYSRGAKDSPDMLGASERLEKVMRTRLQLIRDFQISRSHVLSKIGR